MAVLGFRVRLLLILTQGLKLDTRLLLHLHLRLRLRDRRGRGCRRLLEVGTGDLLPRNESIDDICQALVQKNLDITTITSLLLGRDAQRLEELRRLPSRTCRMLLELMDELPHRRALEVQVHMSRLTLLLKHRKGTNVGQKDTHQEIVHVLALRGLLNALHLGIHLFRCPSRHLRQQVLEGTQDVLDLVIALAELTRRILQAPQTIRDLRDENLTQVVLQVHLDELSRRHLFTRRKLNGAS